jgi:hypothetical protein
MMLIRAMFDKQWSRYRPYGSYYGRGIHNILIKTSLYTSEKYYIFRETKRDTRIFGEITICKIRNFRLSSTLRPITDGAAVMSHNS